MRRPPPQPHTKGNASLDAATEATRRDGSPAGFLSGFGLDASGADTGEPRVVD